MWASKTVPVLAMVSICQAAASAPPNAILLRYKFKTGNIDKYSVDITVTAGGAQAGEDIPTIPVHGSGRNILKVAKTSSDGSAILVETLEAFQFSGNRVSDAPQMSRYRIGARGETVPIGLRRANAIQFGDPSSMAKLTTYLPAHPVKPGDTWTTTAPNPIGGAGNVTASGRFFKIERVDGVDTVRIHQSYTIPLTMDMFAPGTKQIVHSTGNMKMAGAINFDPRAGRIVRSSVTGTGIFTLALPEKSKAKQRPQKKNQKPTKNYKPSAPEPGYKLKVEVISTLLR